MRIRNQRQNIFKKRITIITTNYHNNVIAGFFRKLIAIITTNYHNNIIHISGLNYGQLWQFVSLKNLLFLSLSPDFFVPLQCRRTSYNYVSKHKIFRSHRARSVLFPQHPAHVCLAEIEVSRTGRPRFSAPRAPSPPHLPTIGSQQNLPITRAAITARFSCFSASLTFLSPKSDFH